MQACLVARSAFLGTSLALLSGCASIRPLDATDAEPGGRFITEDMIAKYNAPNAWEVLRHTGLFHMSRDAGTGRPAEIKSRRGRTSIILYGSDIPRVIVDGARLIDLRALRDIPASSIAWIQVLNGMEGTLQEGMNSGAGVILIVSKAGG